VTTENPDPPRKVKRSRGALEKTRKRKWKSKKGLKSPGARTGNSSFFGKSPSYKKDLLFEPTSMGKLNTKSKVEKKE